MDSTYCPDTRGRWRLAPPPSVDRLSSALFSALVGEVRRWAWTTLCQRMVTRRMRPAAGQCRASASGAWPAWPAVSPRGRHRQALTPVLKERSATTNRSGPSTTHTGSRRPVGQRGPVAIHFLLVRAVDNKRHCLSEVGRSSTVEGQEPAAFDLKLNGDCLARSRFRHNGSRYPGW